MERNDQQELLEELMVLGTIVDENPCGMKLGLFSALREVVHSFIGKACIEGASREQVAKYLQRDVRTISNWREKYDDFPEPRKDFRKQDTYDWIDVVRWKLKHKELYQ